MAIKKNTLEAGKSFLGTKTGMRARVNSAGSPGTFRSNGEKPITTPRRAVARRPVKSAEQLVLELQVQQNELEKQNDHLKRTQLELEHALDRYADLYNFSPVAHLTLAADGEILEANPCAAKLLGLEKGRLIRQIFTRFVAAESLDAYCLLCQRVFDIDEGHRLELALVNASSELFFVQLETTRCAANSRQQFHVSLTDITERKQAEARIAQLDRAKTILAGVDHAIIHIPDRQTLLDEICRLVVETGGFKLAWFGRASPDGSVHPVAKAGATGYLDGIRVVARGDEPE